MWKKNLSIDDFDYYLPEDRIARYPLPQRDQSKLLVYKQGVIHESLFKNISDYLTPADLLVFNNTRVVRARLLFNKTTGAGIEIFCLEPLIPADYHLSFQRQGSVTWKCLVGNARRWKSGILNKEISHPDNPVMLYAEKLRKEGSEWHIKFNWEPCAYTFGEILEMTGEVPIPPYLNRDPLPEDRDTYQTIYSSVDGSVAAPTAGFHFTHEIMNDLKRGGIPSSELTLHVGAGTFRPVLAGDFREHHMHSEHVYFSRDILKILLAHKGLITAIGTTSARSLETIYWTGCKIKQQTDTDPGTLEVDQWEDQKIPQLSKVDSLEVLWNYSLRMSVSEFHVRTRLMIIPGYRYHLVNRMITNFHQPRSTLLLLVSALIGDDWRRVYDYAMKNHFRFLSYGDSSLLIP